MHAPLVYISQGGVKHSPLKFDQRFVNLNTEDFKVKDEDNMYPVFPSVNSKEPHRRDTRSVTPEVEPKTTKKVSPFWLKRTLTLRRSKLSVMT